MSEARPLRRELAGSYAVLALNGLVTVLLVPVYLRLLGAEHWGIVALCLTVQGALFAADAMLAPPLLRDVAAAAADGSAYAVYRRYLRLYATIALIVFAAGHVLLLVPAPAAAPREALTGPLRLVLVQFLFQFCNSAAIGYWNGRLQQPYANRRLAVALVAKHAAALTLLLVWRADALAWLLPFAVLGALEFVVNGLAVRREATPLQRSADVPVAPPGVPAYAFAALLGLLGGQVDRLVLSLYLPAADYGRYFLASTVVLSLLQLQVPLLRSFLPRLTTASEPAVVRRAMLSASLLLVALPSVLIACAAEPVTRLWLRDASVAGAIAPWLGLMLPAVALLALYAPFGTVLLAQQRYRLLTRINALALLAQLCVLAAGVTLLGARAGGVAWLACALVQLACVPLILRREPAHG